MMNNLMQMLINQNPKAKQIIDILNKPDAEKILLTLCEQNGVSKEQLDNIRKSLGL